MKNGVLSVMSISNLTLGHIPMSSLKLKVSLYLYINSLTSFFSGLVRHELSKSICHRHGIWDEEKMIWFACSNGNWDFRGDAGRCTDESWHFLCTCTVVFLPKDWSRQL